jgi:hemerythrin superfamily protein
MNALDLLKTQHREVEHLFEEYEKLGEKDVEMKETLFVEIADALAAHASIEERFFYPSVKAEDTEELLHESLEEHLGAKRLIADLLELQGGDDAFDAKMKVLKEQVEHHVEEEEGELFPKVKKMMEEDSLESLGAIMEQEYEEMRKGEPRNQVPSETDEAAPLQ